MIVIHLVTGIPFAQKSRHWQKNFVAGIPIAENLVADAWRLDFIYTEIADTNWWLRDSRGGDIAFVSFQMQGNFRCGCSGSK